MEVKSDWKKNLTNTRDRLRATDQSEIIAEYFSDPEKYNKEPMDPEYVEKCKVESERALKDKERLYVDPSSVKERGW